MIQSGSHPVLGNQQNVTLSQEMIYCIMMIIPMTQSHVLEVISTIQ